MSGIADGVQYARKSMGDGLMLEPEPSSVSKARRYCEACLTAWDAVELVDTVSLLVSELVTNVVLHAGTACELRLERGRRLRVEVVDGSTSRPVRGLVQPDANSGRGLLLVESLSADSGTVVGADGKRVWFEMDWEPTPPS
jgi:hypothetical protein